MTADERWAWTSCTARRTRLLPALLRALRIDEAPWLFGHSDGGSIALLHAARYPDGWRRGALAPHVFVEDVVGAQDLTHARGLAATDLPQRLAPHHDDVGSAFWGSNDISLDPGFCAWNIGESKTIRCPLLAIQGVDDEWTLWNTPTASGTDCRRRTGRI